MAVEDGIREVAVSNRIKIAQEDIDNVAVKLDEFASVLSDREKAVLTAVFGLAGGTIQQWVASGRQTQSGSAPATPPLSAGFREAFSNGVGTTFTIEEDTTSEAEGSKTKIGDSWDNSSLA
jgi:hypothetical protein